MAFTFCEIVNYLVFSPMPLFTMEEMKAYKGLEAHNQFTSGWIRDLCVAYQGVAVTAGKVSQYFVRFSGFLNITKNITQNKLSAAALIHYALKLPTHIRGQLSAHF